MVKCWKVFQWHSPCRKYSQMISRICNSVPTYHNILRSSEGHRLSDCRGTSRDHICHKYPHLCISEVLSHTALSWIWYRNFPQTKPRVCEIYRHSLVAMVPLRHVVQLFHKATGHLSRVCKSLSSWKWTESSWDHSTGGKDAPAERTRIWNRQRVDIYNRVVKHDCG